MTELDTTLEILKSRINLYFDGFGSEDKVVSVIPFLEKSTYPIYLISITDGTTIRKIVVKFAPVFENFNEGMIEYQNMSKVKKALQGSSVDLGFINVLDFYEETNALISEYVDGERFAAWFLERCTYHMSLEDSEDLNKQVTNAGRWLHFFHQMDILDMEVPLNQLLYIEKFTELLSILEVENIFRKFHKTLRSFVKQIEFKVADLYTPVAHVHGDYGLQNMAISDGKIYVFDLQRSYHETIYHDIAYFLVTLETLNPYPKQIFFNRKKAKALRSSFLNGYFSRKLTLEENICLDLIELRNLVQRMIKQYKNLCSRKIPKKISKLIIDSFYSTKISIKISEIKNSINSLS